jgi:urease accessory protein
MDVRIEDGAGLCLLPDPVQPFEKSVYEQHQIFTLMDSASLCLLDWVSAGRTARGENWDLWGWMGKNEIWSAAAAERKARLLLRDNVMLKSDAAESHQNLLRAKMHKLDIFGTLILRGPMLDSLAAFFLKEFSELPRIGGRDFRSHDAKDREKDKLVSQSENWRTARLQQEKDGGVLWSVARVRSCIVVKFGARTVEDGRTWIGSMIKHDGSIVETFGEDAVMCVK